MSGKKSNYREVIALFIVLTLCALAVRFSGTEAPKPVTPMPSKTPEPKHSMEHTLVESDIQMALILDTSSSMDGLIRQARDQIIEIVSDLQVAENGDSRIIAVALYRYGTSNVGKNEGFIECLVPLTTDYQGIVEVLDVLQAGGQEEYAPTAISRAVSELAWNPDPAVPKVVVIVGNETFSAGPIGTNAAMTKASEKKIKVLPIYCVGEHASKSALSGWRNAAHVAGTELIMIDPDQVVETMEQPTTDLTPVQVREPIRTTPPHRPYPKPPSRVLPSYEAKAPYPKSAPAGRYSEMRESAAPRADFRSGMNKGMKSVLKSY
jgi:hypothetical protein